MASLTFSISNRVARITLPKLSLSPLLLSVMEIRAIRLFKGSTRGSLKEVHGVPINGIMRFYDPSSKSVKTSYFDES